MAMLTISVELAARIEAEAKAKGQSVEDMLTDLIQRSEDKIDPAMFGFIDDVEEGSRLTDLFGLMGDIRRTDLSEHVHEIVGEILAEKHKRID